MSKVHVVTEIAPFALGAAISPLVLMLATLALASPPRALSKGWSAVAGNAVMLAGYTGLLLGLGIKLPKHHGPSALDAAIYLGFAGALLLLALRQLAKRGSANGGSGLLAKLGGAKPRAFASAGVVIMATNFSSLALYVPGLHMVQRSHASTPDQIAAAVLLFSCTLAPALVPVLAATLLGRRAQPPLAAINRIVTAYATEISIGIELLFVVLLAWKGFSAI